MLGAGLSIVQAMGSENDMKGTLAVDAVKSHAEQLMKLPGVVAVGVGLCDTQPCVKVFAAASSPELLAQLPKEIDGVIVALEISGVVRAR